MHYLAVFFANFAGGFRSTSLLAAGFIQSSNCFLRIPNQIYNSCLPEAAPNPPAAICHIFKQNFCGHNRFIVDTTSHSGSYLCDMNISSEERLPVFLLDSIPDKQCALSVKGCFLLYFACLFTAFAVNRQAFFFLLLFCIFFQLFQPESTNYWSRNFRGKSALPSNHHPVIRKK